MIHGIEEVNLPSYATLNTATITMQNMGDQTIEATLSIDRGITPAFTEDWVVRFRGVEFIHPLRTPQASKSSEKFNPEYPLTFYHKGIYDLKRKFFFSLPPIESSTAVPDKYEASLSLGVEDFVDAYAQVLAYYYGDYITIDLNPSPSKPFSETEPYDKEKITVSISYTKMWDLLASLYENYNVSWWIEPVLDGDGTKYVIKIGYDRSIVSADGEKPHPFAYGFEGGLLKMERQVQSPDIYNILLGRGGDKNLSYRYYKKQAEDSDGGGDESTFPPDPDWIPELANIPMSELRDINFRYWIQGWKDKHHRYYIEDGDGHNAGDVLGEDDEAVGENVHAPGVRRYAVGEHWAYDIGYDAVTFDPVEYVKDDESIAKYGELWNGLQKVEEIYPSIQGVFLDGQGRADQLVAVQQIDPEYEDDIKNLPEVIEEEVEGVSDLVQFFLINGSGFHKDKEFEGGYYRRFTVKEGYHGNLIYDSYAITNAKYEESLRGDVVSIPGFITLSDGHAYILVREVSDTMHYGDWIPAVGIPAGTYEYKVVAAFDYSYTDRGYASATFTIPSLTLSQTVLEDTKANKNCFDIWVKNIWETEKLPTETDKQYALRVWRPILGDHLGNEAAVVFSSGLLSFSEDYNFILVSNKYPEYDTSKRITCKDADGNDIEVDSHWKLTLRRSDAEYDATGKYLPNSEINAKAIEDYFFFIGVDMPHQYVVWAEQRLNAYKIQQLAETAEINPTWTIELSKIRINHPLAGETVSLISQLGVGMDVRLYSQWFVANPRLVGNKDEEMVRNNGTYTSTIQTLSFKYEAPKQDSSGLLPSVSVTLADKPMTTSSSVSLLQGTVNALTSRVNSMSAPYVIDVIKTTDEITTPTDYNVLSAKRSQRTLLSSEFPDEAEGHITFKRGLSSAAPALLRDATQFGEVFISGQTGVGGRVDKNADAELNSLILRSWLEVPEIRFNRAEVLMGDQWQAPGGGIVESVEIDVLGGEIQPTGTITLKLEDGEIGAVAVNDICKGYFHDFRTPKNNATADADDGKGNTEFSGFCTVYFRITEILNDDGTQIAEGQAYTGRNLKFQYMLRAADGTNGDWHSSFHPYEQMHFVAYGNFEDTSRQKSAYQTRTYTRYLKGVDAWEFTVHNIAMQFGDLSNLQVFKLNMTGYSAYLQNIYMSGTLHQVDIEAETVLTVDTNTGDFFIADGETLMLTCTVRKAWKDLTADVTDWSITRSSGDADADAAWNAAANMYASSYGLQQSDVGATTLNANSLFTITARGDGWEASKTIAVRTLRLPTTLTMRFVSEYGAQDTFISYGDTVQFQAVIEDGLRNDYTAEYDQWSIVRHNGDTPSDVASDGVWNATRAAISSSGLFSIEWSAEHDDLQAERATFIVTAQKGSDMASQVTGTLSI